MSPVWVNGRALGVASNGFFTKDNTDSIPGGKLWPEAALTWNAMRRAAIAGGIKPWEFMPAGPRSSARARADQDYFWTHQPPPAARPYTSNHGWAIAVDALTRRAASWIMRHGAKWGWSWDEGRRVGEWWHMRYVGVSKRRLKAIKKGLDPLGHLKRDERKWIKELDKLRHQHKNVDRRRELITAIGGRAHEIQRNARREHNGWKHYNRDKRFRTLRSRIT